MQTRFLRSHDVRQLIGTPGKPMAHSTLYFQVNDGVAPPPIKFGERTSLWIRAEIEAVIQARIAGLKSPDIRTLVAELVARRAEPATTSEAVPADAATPRKRGRPPKLAALPALLPDAGATK